MGLTPSRPGRGRRCYRPGLAGHRDRLAVPGERMAVLGGVPEAVRGSEAAGRAEAGPRTRDLSATRQRPCSLPATVSRQPPACGPAASAAVRSGFGQ